MIRTPDGKCYPGVGVVALLHDGKGRILIGKRKGSHGAGTWGLPGGKIEAGETAFETIVREVKEETGLEIPRSRFRRREWLDNIWADRTKGKQHWVTLFVEADLREGDEPQVMEPEKCEEWQFVDPLVLTGGSYALFPPLASFLLAFPVRKKVR